jgi:hypothetical protein
MEGSIEQHELFEARLEKFQEYVYGASKDEYDGQKFKDVIKSFGKMLEEHLRDEAPALLILHYLDSRELTKTWARAKHAATHNVDQYRQVSISAYSRAELIVSRNGPFVMECRGNTFLLNGEIKNFPRAPLFVPWLSARSTRVHSLVRGDSTLA